MISFIVIGRNEEKNLKRCIEGIYRAISFNGLDHYEIIYVDSRSTDRSVDIVRQFPEVRIFAVTGHCNAAIGRNIGAREATGNSLFFIDADMEIQPDFIGKVWDQRNDTLLDEFVSGNLIDIVGSQEIKRSSNKILPGGIYLVKKDLWEAVGGMDNKFRSGEDYDFGLRMIKKGVRFKRRDAIITKHFTVPNLDKTRVWKAVWNRYAFYPRCVLLRNHLLTPQMYLMLWKNDKTFVLLVAALIATIFYPLLGVALWAVYLGAVIVRSFHNKSYLTLAGMAIYYIVTDVLNLVYLFTFFPRRKKEEYKLLKASVIG